MKLSLNWIQSYIKESLNVDLVLEKLTQAGIELESIEASEHKLMSDKIVEFKITPNRGDCLSAYGIAREIVGIDNYTLKPLEDINFTSATKEKLNINIIAKDFCPNYFGLIIQDVDNTIATPDYIMERLQKSKIRLISAIVDIANYVMLDIGQPLHAFDMDVIGNSITVRLANNAEEMVALDGSELILATDTLIIADSNDKVVAIAGVMGSMDSGVTLSTTNIVLESAFFTPKIISGKAKYYGVGSDAAYRFERGVDPELQLRAIKQVASLIQQYCGGKCGIINSFIDNSYNVQNGIELNYKKINQIAGYEFTLAEIVSILIKLGFRIENNNENECVVFAPSYRFDIKIKEDIIEEVLRSYGYHNIPEIMPNLSHHINEVDTDFQHLNSLKNKLCIMGFNEIVAYSFQEEKIEVLVRDNTNQNIKPVVLQNSIANWDVMRTNLLGDLLKSYQYNTNRGHKAIKLFETGTVFFGEAVNEQPLKIAGIIGGDLDSISWNSTKREVDFFDLKHVVETLLLPLDNVTFIGCNTNNVFHAGRCSTICINNVVVGIIGQLNPQLATQFDLDDIPYLFELDVNKIKLQNHVKIDPLSKIPKQYRDLAFVLDIKIPSFDIITFIRNSNIPYLLDAHVFDVYIGNLADLGKKSLGIRFIMQGIDKTLNDEEINFNVNALQKMIEQKFMATLR